MHEMIQVRSSKRSFSSEPAYHLYGAYRWMGFGPVGWVNGFITFHSNMINTRATVISLLLYTYLFGRKSIICCELSKGKF